MAKKPTPVPRAKSGKLLGKLRHNIPGYTLLLIGFVVGVLWFGSLRFLLVHPVETHYHSNFAVYINGQREEFKSFAYYEEVAACTSDFANNIKGRVHMHDQVNDVIHIHDKRVTYQDFFENLGWSIGSDFIHSDTSLYANSDTSIIKYMLNGKQVNRVDGTVIGDKDRLLVSYGTVDEDINTQFSTVGKNAVHIDEEQDPASCGGLNGPEAESFSARMRRAIGIDQ